jgi:hypothetical protein
MDIVIKLLRESSVLSIDAANEISALRNQLAECQKDAERYQYIRHTVGANYGKVDNYSFTFPWLNTKVNLMQGSVAGHLDKAVDKAMSEKG